MTVSPEPTQPSTGALSFVLDFLRRELANRPTTKPLIVGLCGAQGSGKSTLTSQATAALTDEGHRVLAISIDELYLSLADRLALAENVHPLLRTRGVPGTHEVALGERLFDSAAGPGLFQIPSFDKAADDRLPENQWVTVEGPFELVLLEGWCVGARAQPAEALTKPVNELERLEDAQSVWRNFANSQLDGPYRRLFERLDRLILLAAPDFSIVGQWRKQQEDDLRRRLPGDHDGTGIMDDAALDRFIRHYERITRHILSKMPGYADLVVRLDENRAVVAVDPTPNTTYAGAPRPA